ncbi:hypothetical protein D187_008097 [Cystobacter fuscus DSM 2262]|uniref:Uncharacterized protein n=1 Tax=Cystobacter fuscus (strain ATCC 25194 / DSM 2262 / NBRC 100088 / M29) TaxID=1242864 RepID=S9NX15_CYSF2|nr:hypothetical protein [Cystobacter fuscus]EPX56755.1 hypothetical protein D187_008097 [Cystobacter fuscus DSM 2262]
MPIAVRHVHTQPSKTVTFDFGDHKVLSYTVGLAYWRLSFDNDNHVRTLKISLSPNQPNATQITVKVNGEIRDDSGNTIHVEESSAEVCCIAVVDTKDSNVLLTSVNGISAGTQYGPIALPSSSLSMGAAFISGFELGYGSDNHVLSLELSTGFNANGTSGYIKADASMSDSSGNMATTAKLDAGLLATSLNQDGVYSVAKNNLQASGTTVPVEFKVPLSDAVVLLQDYQVRFAKDHHVRSIGGGCEKWTVEGNTVRLTAPKAFIKDDSGNTESSSSSVSLLVVGIPKT